MKTCLDIFSAIALVTIMNGFIFWVIYWIVEAVDKYQLKKVKPKRGNYNDFVKRTSKKT